jgi:hypothetical protein
MVLAYIGLSRTRQECRMKYAHILLPPFIAVTLLSASGCGERGARAVRVRYINAVVDAPGMGSSAGAIVDFFHEPPDSSSLTPLVGNIPFGGASTYVPVPQGKVRMVVRVGNLVVLGPDVGKAAEVEIGSEPIQTVAVAGKYAAEQTQDKLQPPTPRVVHLIDAVPASTTAVRLVHLSPDSPPVDLQVGGSPVLGLTNVPYGGTSRYVTVEPGMKKELTVHLHASSTALSNTNWSLTPVAGKAYTLMLVGLKPPDPQKPPDPITSPYTLRLEVIPDN